MAKVQGARPRAHLPAVDDVVYDSVRLQQARGLTLRGPAGTQGIRASHNASKTKWLHVSLLWSKDV